MSELDSTRLRELLDYNPETGVFIWKVKPNKKDPIGMVAGCPTRGYVRIKVLGSSNGAHRLAWLYVHGNWPKDLIDHINGNGLDNRICNLREATNKQNSHNVKGPQINGTSGYLGVWFDKDSNKWAARIQVDGKKKRLGKYKTPELAYEAYIAAKRELHPFTML